MPSINFFYEDTDFRLTQIRKYKSWLSASINREGRSVSEINFIFTSDTYLHQLNVAHLNHDTLTDVITFDHSEDDQALTADIFISVERVRDNAETFHVPFNQELQRVMIHGVLHLIGYGDKTGEQLETMRAKEDLHIASFDAP